MRCRHLHPLTAMLAVLVFLPSAWAMAQQTAQSTVQQTEKKAIIRPEPRWGGGWMKRHQSFNAQVKQGNVDLLMIGDSITHGWEKAGRKIWEKYYGDRNAVNLAISGDRTQHVLWRLENGNIEGISPKLAVLMIGTNNHMSSSPEKTAEDIEAIIEKLRTKMPKMKVLVLAIFPRGANDTDRARQVNMKVNELIAKQADGRMVHFLNINDAFLTNGRTLSDEVMPDRTHPSEKGYAIWAKAMEPMVARLMGEVPDSQSWDSPFDYRSISFGTPSSDGPPDPMGTKVTGRPFEGIRLDLNRDMVRLAAELGFNDVTIQTERYTVPKLEALRKWADDTGNFRFIKAQGMTTSVWVHELCDLPADVGPPTLDNEKLWTILRQRYAHLCRLLPEVDYFVLTVVESDLWVTENVDVLTKLVTIVNDECRKANKKLIFRTFLWYVKEADVIMESLTKIPQDAIVMSKCVPQDWHLRGVDSPFIGRSGKRDQFIEFDIAGEYNKLTHVACAFTDVLRQRLDYAQQHNCDGFAVRVDRYGGTCWGQAQEANLWFLGLYGSGRCNDEQKIWRLYATELFGPKAAPAMVEALYPTGDVVAEAICVERESFGYSRDVTPACRRMNCPFDVLHSPAKWDKSLRPTFERIASGDPEIIRRKQAAFEKHLASADHSLRLIESVKGELPPGAYPFFRWKLEENRFVLNMFCHMELAWLKDQRMRRTGDSREKDELAVQVRGHLSAFRQMHDAQTGKTLKVTWRGATHSLRRGSCHNWLGWLQRFEKYHRSASVRKVVDTGIAAGKPATCSSEHAGSHPARHANDGDPNTRWCADDDRGRNWWQVDLTRPFDVERIRILWQFNDRVYQFKIDGSTDGKQWTLLVDETENGEVARQTEHATSARGIRYVRITVTGLKGRQWASFHEFQVFGRASSQETGDNS